MDHPYISTEYPCISMAYPWVLHGYPWIIQKEEREGAGVETGTFFDDRWQASGQAA